MTTLTIHPSWFREPDFSDYDYSQDDEYDGLEEQETIQEEDLTPQEILRRNLDKWGYY